MIQSIQSHRENKLFLIILYTKNKKPCGQETLNALPLNKNTYIKNLFLQMLNDIHYNKLCQLISDKDLCEITIR